LGCGDGYLTHLLCDKARSVTGVDPEPGAVRAAGEKLRSYENCTVVEGSCYDLPFPADSFDVVVMADVIEHLEDDDRSVAEIARVLTDDGEAIITTPRRRPDRPIGEYHVREYTAEELRNLCLRHFAEVEIVCLWPIWWANAYRTRIGWRLIKHLGRYLYNPFLREGSDPERFAQLLARCSRPSPGAADPAVPAV
jgi:SAM-dependent methyltransferase